MRSEDEVRGILEKAFLDAEMYHTEVGVAEVTPFTDDEKREAASAIAKHLYGSNDSFDVMHARDVEIYGMKFDEPVSFEDMRFEHLDIYDSDLSNVTLANSEFYSCIMLGNNDIVDLHDKSKQMRMEDCYVEGGIFGFDKASGYAIDKQLDDCEVWDTCFKVHDSDLEEYVYLSTDVDDGSELAMLAHWMPERAEYHEHSNGMVIRGVQDDVVHALEKACDMVSLPTSRSDVADMSFTGEFIERGPQGYTLLPRHSEYDVFGKVTVDTFDVDGHRTSRNEIGYDELSTFFDKVHARELERESDFAYARVEQANELGLDEYDGIPF